MLRQVVNAWGAAVNRRMDEWVRLDQMDLSTVDPPDGAEPGR